MPTGGSHLYRALQQRKNTALRRRLRDLLFVDSTLVPTSADIRPGARTFVQPRVQEFGEAIIQSPDAADFRLTEIKVDELEYRIFMIGQGYKLTFGETQAQEFAQSNGQQFSTRDVKMDGTIRVIQEKANLVAAFGDTSVGVTGALNDAGVTLVDSSFDAYDRVTNRAVVVAEWFLDNVNAIAIATNNVEHPTVACVATDLFKEMASRSMGDASNETILSFVKRVLREASTPSAPGIQEIIPLVECRSDNLEANGAQSGGTNKDRIWLYPKYPEVLEKHVLSGVVQSFPEEWAGQGAGFKTYPMYTCMSQHIYNFPGAIRYIDHPKS